MAHAVDVGLEFLISIHRYVLDKVVVAQRVGQQMIASVFRILSLANQVFQRFLLEGLGVSVVPFQLFLAGNEEFTGYLC